MAKPLNGVAYLRRSSNRQLENHSLNIQREQILRCAEMYGYTIVSWFVDDAVSAYHRSAKNRPAMQDLFATVLREDIQGIFFYDESRVSRQMSDFVLEVYEPIRESKPHCNFYNAMSGLWDPQSTAVQAQLLLAEHESLMKSARATDTQRTLLHHPNGPRRPGAPAPYGYSANNQVLVPNDFAGIVLFMFHLASWGYSDSNVADLLNAAEVPSPKGGKWQPSTVDVILNNPIYRGALSWNRRVSHGNSARRPYGQFDLFEGEVEPIVSEALWDRVHQLRDLKKRTGQKTDTPHMFQGVCICRKCGTQLRVKDSTPAGATKKYVAYKCPTCRGKVDTRKLDETVFRKIEHEWGNQSAVFEKQARKTLQVWKQAMLGQNTLLKSELEDTQYQRAVLTPESIHFDMWRNILDMREKIAIQRLELIQTILAQIENLSQEEVFKEWMSRFHCPSWTGVLSPIEKRTFCLLVVESVEVDLKSFAVGIKFRLSPFVAVEDAIGHITESSKDVLGAKPNLGEGA